MLDDTMSYSNGIFETAQASLHDASIAKIDRLCRKLQLGPSDHLVEIGSGWGGLAVHAAENYGCRVTTTTISSEQHRLASERVRRHGLQDRVTVLLEDYRDLRGSFTKLVSVEMIEAIGWQYFDTYFAVCSRLLTPDGLAAIQAICQPHRAYLATRDSASFIKNEIFPGGICPSVQTLLDSAEAAGDLRLVDLEDITASYPLTLAAWRANFLGNAGRLHPRFDERFRRCLGAVPLPLRGRFHRGPHLRRPAALRQVGLPSPPPAALGPARDGRSRRRPGRVEGRRGRAALGSAHG